MLKLNAEHILYKEAKSLLDSYDLPYIDVSLCTFKSLASENGKVINNLEDLGMYVENVKGGYGE